MIFLHVIPPKINTSVFVFLIIVFGIVFSEVICDSDNSKEEKDCPVQKRWFSEQLIYLLIILRYTLVSRINVHVRLFFLENFQKKKN